jgi:hypothetical protein
MDSSKLKVIAIGILSAFMALYLGVAAATAQMEAIAWVVGALGIFFLIALGRHVWVLVPLGLAFSGGLNCIPGGPPVWWFTLFVASTMMFARFLSRTNDLQFRFTWLDVAVLLQVIAIAQAWLRNPVGFSIFGGDTAGGRPYIGFAMGFAAYFVISLAKADMKTIRLIVLLSILISIGDAFLQLASQFMPGLASAVLPIYSGVDFTAATSDTEVDAMEQRVGGGKEIGAAIGLALVSLYPPLTTINPLYFYRFSGMCLAVGFIMISGFRSVFGMLGIYFFMSLFVRRQYQQMVLTCFLAGMAAIALLVSGTAVQSLPAGAQRILSVLPFAQVDEAKRENAESSSNWRFEMWELALTTDRYIRNKLLGDGFGMSATEMRAQMDAVMGDKRRSMGMSVQDTMLARGSFHGFHVETIRFTGVLGLLLALTGMGIFLRQAWILIRHYRGNPYWSHVIFICLPFLIHPFYYMLIFGSYKVSFIQVIAMAGMLKVLDNIRVRELAEARAAAPRQALAGNASNPSAGARQEPPRGLPVPAMRTNPR